VTLTRAEAVHRLAVALDVSSRESALDLVRRLAGHVGVIKVGLEAFTAHGPVFVEEVRSAGLPVFLDLKLHDIPNTVERAARNCARLGVRLLTVHAGGGEAMLRAARAGAEAGTGAAAERPLVIAVTVLTSLDDVALATLDLPGGAAARALRWASLARDSGCDGAVCSPHEAAALRAATGPEFVLVTPGIRPVGEASGDQRRVATPAAAVAAGADLLVVGRPITSAADPPAAADAIVAELCGAVT
jgi:orotidine-5'-phosphate decarboxylase